MFIKFFYTRLKLSIFNNYLYNSLYGTFSNPYFVGNLILICRKGKTII